MRDGWKCREEAMWGGWWYPVTGTKGTWHVWGKVRKKNNMCPDPKPLSEKRTGANSTVCILYQHATV